MTAGDATNAAAGVSAEEAAAGPTSAVMDDCTWSRGVQQTDEDAVVESETIMAVWYASCTLHKGVGVSTPWTPCHHSPTPICLPFRQVSVNSLMSPLAHHKHGHFLSLPLPALIPHLSALTVCHAT